MAKAILEFDLNEPDDRDAHKRAVKALDMILTLWEYDQYLRTQVKYNEQLTDDQYTAFDEARTKLRDIMNENNISFDELLH